MFAVTFDSYGGPEVLRVKDVPDPQAGPGTIRIRTKAASVNPVDWKIRAGSMAERMPVTFPGIPGMDAAGIVDQIGDGVEGFAVGDEVIGMGAGTSAEFTVLRVFGRKPQGISWAEAAAMPLVSETAERALNTVNVEKGDTLLVEGAAGGVGSAIVQLARARGARVVGTASERNHEYLRSLGAIPTTYGAGLEERLRGLGFDKFDAVIDTAGSGSIPILVTLVDDPQQVVSIADFNAAASGARVSRSSNAESNAVIGKLADIREKSGYDIRVEKTFPFSEASTAHELGEAGKLNGKIVLVTD